jgi:hypothetical protein
MNDQLTVRSHVSRDLLQGAGLFKNERLVVWEYVANELEYVDPGISPLVRVRLDSKKRKITVVGNGRGMDWSGPTGLEHFFFMHGENPDRKAGRPGRGFFGTGKSAAFGIGDVLRITTVRGGKRSSVELRREDLEAADTGDPVPVRTLEREVSSDEPNGTRVEIEGIHLRALDQASVIHYVERHLAHWPKDVRVIVNNHECEFSEPPVERILTHNPPEALTNELDGCQLVLKVSKSPLEEDLRGVSIFAQGVWHETTLLTSHGKDMAEFIFGEIDVPQIASDTSAPPPFDVSRSMRLNPDNQIVQAIFSFVGPCIEQLRKELVDAQRQQRETEEAKRLRKEASQIEDIINRDFDAFRKRLQKVKAAAAGTGLDAGEATESGGSSGDDEFLFGGDEPATVTNLTGETGTSQEGNGGVGGAPRRLNPIVEPDSEGSSRGHYEGERDQKPRRRGGFQIEFDNQGEISARATYQAEKRTIYVNLDHPQISAAKQGRSAEDPTFRRLAYEVAFSEYAMALAQELDNRGEYLDPSDPIVDIRETINRVAREAAPLYV